MKTRIFKLLLLVLCISISSCNNKTSKELDIEYKYSDKAQVINCENINNKLLNEALYTFEDDILKSQNTDNVGRAYSLFFRNAMSNRLKVTDIVSEHTKEVFEALKTEKELWSGKNLNYNSAVINCIGQNMTVQDLKITLNALISTNSMSSKLFGEPLRTSISQATRDKYLALYIALDFYYSKLHDIDFNKINFQAKQSKVDFNKLPQ